MLRRAPYICHRCSQTRQVVVSVRRHASYSTSAATLLRDRPPHVAIIGSGPAGFYSAYRLQKKIPDVRIDMYEQLPVPFGLARFGVAPDHPEVKKCTETLIDVAKSPHFNFVGNIPIGDEAGSLPLTAIAPHYDAILFAYGASRDKKLGIPGEDLNGVYSARAFVGWYNGLPEHADLNPDLLSGDTAVVIGQGNVALDVTRILLAPLADLRKTDIAEHAIEALSKSRVRDVKVIGRRGPLQAPYTIKELRELMQLPGVGFKPPPESWDDLMQAERKKLPRQLKRIAELLEKGSKTPLDSSEKAWQLGYLRSPAAFLSQDSKSLAAVGFTQTTYVEPASSIITGDPQNDLNAIRAIKVKSTETKTLIHTPLAFNSVGYKSEALSGMADIGVPFDKNTGIIPNDRWGRVLSPSKGPAGPLTAGHVPGMYCAGWVKRGPTGVIASTLDDAFTTGDILARDWTDGVSFANHNDTGSRGGWQAVKPEISRRGLRPVTWNDWQAIDAEEIKRGQALGKVKEKFSSVEEMLKVLDA
ncbi:nadph:adrenodoxin oxidoreductase, mitochondrial [Acrodontium crateriforme]|uniref:NADPH:adrenodoxin oxidoreductase, mitochondrial n=1 Tax=Acrodontium crateriforme TaxID=150365 RepID=A0AAQ3R2V6_9PEZI|nr:nadph:adrenodoxin oxidoreductase, mitochondrial [Acrodontium crateriforme]